MNNERNPIEVLGLSSGAKLISVYSELPLSTASVWFRAGARFDPHGKEGLAHFFEHLLMTKTQKYPDKQQLLSAMSREGMRYNATTTYETASYYYEQPDDKTYSALDFLVEGLNTSLITEDDVHREKEVILDEMSRRDNNPMRYIARLNHAALWPQASLGRSLLGTQESLNGVALADVLKFKNDYYQSDNAAFLLIGNHDQTKTVDAIEHSYRSSNKKALPLAPEDLGVPRLITVDYRPLNQVTVAVNFRTVAERSHADAVTLDFIASYYMANPWIAQLNQKMRLESNLTYWVNGSSINFYDTGFVNFVFSTTPDKCNKALGTVFQEIEKLKAGKITRDDFEGCKALARASFLRKSITPYDLMEWYGWQAKLGEKIYSPEEYLAEIMAIAPEDIQRIAHK